MSLMQVCVTALDRAGQEKNPFSLIQIRLHAPMQVVPLEYMHTGP